VRAVINPNNVTQSENIGVLGYLNPATLNGYSLTMNFGPGTLDLSRIASGVETGLATDDIPGSFPSTGTFTLELLINAGTLTGRVYDSLSNPPLLTISANDATYDAGLAGIIAQRAQTTPTLNGTFGTVTAAVPEPSTIGMAFAGVVSIGCLVARRARGRSAA
jgi:hypothetical protein